MGPQEYTEEPEPCWRCDGDGIIVICPDDMCQGQGWCMYGDGEIICTVCGGDGVLYPQFEEWGTEIENGM